MLFWLKKTVAFWLMPLPFCLLLLVAGWWLGRSARRARLGRTLMASGMVLLLLFSNRTVSTRLIAPLENSYPSMPELRAGALPADLAACRYVAVLGGGNGNTPGLSATNELSASALGFFDLRRGSPACCRAAAPGRFISQGRAARRGDRYPRPRPSVLARAATAASNRNRIDLIETARDTEDESQAVRALVGDSPVALVTSAAHMRWGGSRCTAASRFLSLPD